MSGGSEKVARALKKGQEQEKDGEPQQASRQHRRPERDTGERRPAESTDRQNVSTELLGGQWN